MHSLNKRDCCEKGMLSHLLHYLRINIASPDRGPIDAHYAGVGLRQASLQQRSVPWPFIYRDGLKRKRPRGACRPVASHQDSNASSLVHIVGSIIRCDESLGLLLKSLKESALFRAMPLGEPRHQRGSARVLGRMSRRQERKFTAPARCHATTSTRKKGEH